MKTSVEIVTELVGPTISALGVELWGIERISQGKFSLLRIFIERETGVSIEDCEKVSRQVSALLDVEEPISGEFTLEVSSPGLDRPLFNVDQFQKFLGSEVRLRTRTPIEGRRKFKGLIEGVSGGIISVRVEGEKFYLQQSDIEKANIVFE